MMTVNYLHYQTGYFARKQVPSLQQALASLWPWRRFAQAVTNYDEDTEA